MEIRDLMEKILRILEKTYYGDVRFDSGSAIGIGKNKKLYLIAVDGRHNGYSVGVTFQELAQILKKLDLKDAINLDGGGSTTLVADGQIINTLSEHHERKVSNALLIFYK